jgi:hypothetical protein
MIGGFDFIFQTNKTAALVWNDLFQILTIQIDTNVEWKTWSSLEALPPVPLLLDKASIGIKKLDDVVDNPLRSPPLRVCLHLADEWPTERKMGTWPPPQRQGLNET